MLTPKRYFFFFFYYPSYKIYESITKMEKIKYKYKIENLNNFGAKKVFESSLDFKIL
jgi:hypothetical protein